LNLVEPIQTPTKIVQSNPDTAPLFVNGSFVAICSACLCIYGRDKCTYLTTENFVLRLSWALNEGEVVSGVGCN